MYPLKFKPRLKERVWGGTRLTDAGKKPPRGAAAGALYGESWEISGIEGDESVVANGELRDNNLAELAEVYMGDLVGEEIFEKYGDEFPVLVKFIDAREKLSVQVHPSDELAAERHNSRGKTEMWYVMAADEGAILYVGFAHPTSREEYIQAVTEGRETELLRRYEVHAGEAYFIPAGVVHAIGDGVLIAEIQETSDITYRISDWGRMDDNGKPRQLHIDEALDAIDFSDPRNYDISVRPEPNTALQMVTTEHFTSSQINLSGTLARDYSLLDSFIIYICVAGSCIISTDNSSIPLKTLETILIPADIDTITITGFATLLEVYI